MENRASPSRFARRKTERSSSTWSRHLPRSRLQKAREDALKKPGGLERAVKAKTRKSVADCISDYIDASPEGFGKSKSQMLSYFQRLDFGASAIEDLLARDFVKIAMELLSGLQARPVDPQKDTPAHYTFKPRKRSTDTW